MGGLFLLLPPHPPFMEGPLVLLSNRLHSGWPMSWLIEPKSNGKSPSRMTQWQWMVGMLWPISDKNLIGEMIYLWFFQKCSRHLANRTHLGIDRGARPILVPFLFRISGNSHSQAGSTSAALEQCKVFGGRVKFSTRDALNKKVRPGFCARFGSCSKETHRPLYSA